MEGSERIDKRVAMYSEYLLSYLLRLIKGEHRLFPVSKD